MLGAAPTPLGCLRMHPPSTRFRNASIRALAASDSVFGNSVKPCAPPVWIASSARRESPFAAPARRPRVLSADGTPIGLTFHHFDHLGVQGGCFRLDRAVTEQGRFKRSGVGHGSLFTLAVLFRSAVRKVPVAAARRQCRIADSHIPANADAVQPRSGVPDRRCVLFWPTAPANSASAGGSRTSPRRLKPIPNAIASPRKTSFDGHEATRPPPPLFTQMRSTRSRRI